MKAIDLIFKRKAAISIGLDIGKRRINMVKLTASAGGPKLVDFASVALKSPQNREEKLEALKKIAQEKGISAHPVNIGVSGESVIVRYINLPKMSREELGQALAYEAQQYIPFKMEEVVLDYHILTPRVASSSNRMKVFLVAAKKQAIMEFVELIHEAGLEPNIIDVNIFSLINCFQVNGPQLKEEDVAALINLEFDLVNIGILQGEMPFFSRDLSVLEDFLLLQQQQQQEENKEKGLFETIKPLLTNLIREIRVSIDYYESEFERQVGVVYISGEGAQIPGLLEFFKAELGREIKTWNPLEKLLGNSTGIDSAKLNEVSPTLAVGCGLALRGVSNK
ncbi:MAG: type IV pilus assembly protein PilM [Candidatus Omnitrophota bacterium]|nr:MAG: type IV pilus assembly protein PilM [Candidatus Omnitrophota bacterium]